MKRNLRAQMVGFHHPCIFIQDHHNQDYYEFLHEADEFGAAAGTYPTEREELLAKFAGALQAPLVKTAGLLQALPRNFAYGLNALIEKQAA